MKKPILNALSLLLLVCLLAGCKPSEKNYRAAYEVAVAKRQSEAPDLSAGLGDAVRDGAPKRHEVGGKTVWVLTEPLSCVDSQGAPL